MNKTLVIEISYGGLGDLLFHSHLPRIAKEYGGFQKVLINQTAPVRHADYARLVWEPNPYVDGFTDQTGIKIDIGVAIQLIEPGCNLLDSIMKLYGLSDGKRMHEPEIYYKPRFIKEYNITIYDPNFISWVGDIDKRDVMWHTKKHAIKLNAYMKLRNDKALFIPPKGMRMIDTPTIFDYCDLVHSAAVFYCLTSGSAAIASALGKKAIAFYGFPQSKGIHHSGLHEYIRIERCPRYKISNFVKTPIKQLLKIFKGK